MILLPGLLLVLWGEPAPCLGGNSGFTFDGDVRQFAVHNHTVYVSTEDTLYQLTHDLVQVRTLSQSGIVTGDPNNQNFTRVSGNGNATFRVNLLLPFPQNGTVVSCGVVLCGYCELLHLDDVTKVLYRENIQVGSVLHSSSRSIGILVNVSGEIYILTGNEQRGVSVPKKNPDCPSDSITVNLHDTNEKQHGGIFSVSTNPSTVEMIKGPESGVEFVDVFQIRSIIYVLSNVIQSHRVRLLWLQGENSKAQTVTSLRGANLTVPGKLISSAVVPEGALVVPGGAPPVLWAGVFSADGEPQDTELLLFNISPDLSKESDMDPDFCSVCTTAKPTLKSLAPITVLLRQDLMSSVLAVRQKAWMVFFIGTADGQLIKLAVDNNYHTTCPSVLYKSNDDRRVFPKMHLDQVDLKHVYVVLQNQMQRIPVSTCGTRDDVQRCWSAQDPYCVWCSSTKRCMFEDECPDSDWISVPDDVQKKMVSHSFTEDAAGTILFHVRTHVTAGQNALAVFTCQFLTSSGKLCSPSPNFPQCTCVLPQGTLPAEGLHVDVRVQLGATELKEQLTVTNCSDITGPPTSATCQRCLEAGCHWNKSQCSWSNQGVQDDGVCKRMDPGINFLKPQISSISPDIVSFYGRNHAALNGFNLSHVTRVRLQANSDCTPKESPVWNNTGNKLTFHIPRTDKKGTVKVCVVLPDDSCHGNAEVTYKSSPSCTDISPSNAWSSGGRTMTLIGSHLEFVEGVVHHHALLEVRPPRDVNYQNLTYDTPAAGPGVSSSSVLVRLANETLACSTTVTYYPDPEFTSFTFTEAGEGVLINIQKKSDKLDIVPEELSVWGVQAGQRFPCIMIPKDTANETNYFLCKIHKSPNAKFKQLLIMYGEKTITLVNTSYHLYLLYLLALLLIPCILGVGCCVFQSKRKKLTAKMNRRMEDLELDIRNDIRQGFVDLQTEKADLMESVGAIPFLDYKHFASRIFFPESEPLMALCIKDIGQDGLKVQLGERCQRLAKLLQDQLFLTSMVHALEEQKSFTIKDKCALASLLTVALHNDLSYLTEVMEALLRDLTQKNSNSQPKLLLRRTESIVEKLLTNWMSICLYGFLRESVGQQLFLMVNALTQQTAKGPVDCVTERALYTLSEDWLLWQAPDFSPLKLKVMFATGRDGEVSEPLEVSALTCDSIEQLKEKILSTFRAKFGFAYNTPLRDVHIELEHGGSAVALQEVDSSSEVVGEVTMLNTLKHYKVPDGATIKVFSRKNHPPLSPQGSLKDDENFSGKYFHLIDPDVDEVQRRNPERKKFKLKEVHLTKLLSTKVAVHSFVENLFRSIWGTPHSRAPHAVKYFFDFLDAQADSMKITDPDVLHIWKTNSLPLRFWINILKNPQFVFDMEKTPQLESCLSVIAQAFMDSFSLSELQLGKHAPTNKLLYAKDIPKYKQEVKSYYKQIRDQPPITESEFKQFLREESKKHENEFNEAAALREVYKFIQRYFTEIKEKLNQNGAPAELTEQLHDVKNSFDQQKSLLWE